MLLLLQVKAIGQSMCVKMLNVQQLMSVVIIGFQVGYVLVLMPY